VNSCFVYKREERMKKSPFQLKNLHIFNIISFVWVICWSGFFKHLASVSTNP
jgi:hypothetical protein